LVSVWLLSLLKCLAYSPKAATFSKNKFLSFFFLATWFHWTFKTNIREFNYDGHFKVNVTQPKNKSIHWTPQRNFFFAFSNPSPETFYFATLLYILFTIISSTYYSQLLFFWPLWFFNAKRVDWSPDFPPFNPFPLLLRRRAQARTFRIAHDNTCIFVICKCKKNMIKRVFESTRVFEEFEKDILLYMMLFVYRRVYVLNYTAAM